MTDREICGFQLANGLCTEPRKDKPGAIRCDEHEHPRFKICVGCGNLAHRECADQTGANFCFASLCMTCVHVSVGVHAPPEHPAARKTEPPSQASNVRADLVEALSRALQRMVDAEQLRLGRDVTATLVADILVDDLAAHALLALMAGMAQKGA